MDSPETPVVYRFNPFTEEYLASGKGFTPRRRQADLARDLENIPQFLCGPQDVVLVEEAPSREFLRELQAAGLAVPEFVVMREGEAPAGLRGRKLAGLRPWAWGPDSRELAECLAGNLGGGRAAEDCFNEGIARLYSKAWSAGFLNRLLLVVPEERWLCGRTEAGVAVRDMGAALDTIRKIRGQGHHRVVVKRAFGLAGSNAVRLWEPDILETQRRWMEETFAVGGELVVERWLERQVDFSAQLEMTDWGLELRGYTGLMNDLKGQFQANWAAPDYAVKLPSEVVVRFAGVPNVAERLQELYAQVWVELASELRRVGYRGPLGIDAFVFRGADGVCRLKPVVEINPRYTMGRLTLELMRRAEPGRYGVFRLLTLPMVRAKGAGDFPEYAQGLKRAEPVVLTGEPEPRIRGGTVCLNDPARARTCLATFQVLDRSPG